MLLRRPDWVQVWSDCCTAQLCCSQQLLQAIHTHMHTHVLAVQCLHHKNPNPAVYIVHTCMGHLCLSGNGSCD